MDETKLFVIDLTEEDFEKMYFGEDAKRIYEGVEIWIRDKRKIRKKVG